MMMAVESIMGSLRQRVRKGKKGKKGKIPNKKFFFSVVNALTTVTRAPTNTRTHTKSHTAHHSAQTPHGQGADKRWEDFFPFATPSQPTFVLLFHRMVGVSCVSCVCVVCVVSRVETGRTIFWEDDEKKTHCWWFLLVVFGFSHGNACEFVHAMLLVLDLKRFCFRFCGKIEDHKSSSSRSSAPHWNSNSMHLHLHLHLHSHSAILHPPFHSIFHSPFSILHLAFQTTL
jgi:hypothetical protein